MDLAATLAKPAWSFEELCVVLGLPDSTVELIAREQPAPPFFLLGRRRYILRADALEWLEERRNAHPWTPRKNCKKVTKKRAEFVLASIPTTS